MGCSDLAVQLFLFSIQVLDVTSFLQRMRDCSKAMSGNSTCLVYVYSCHRGHKFV